MSKCPHSHNVDVSLRRLIIIITLNFTITIAELIGGILSGSLALLSDALHNFSDGISIIVSYIALRLSKRPNTLKNTFGLRRAEIMAALFNTTILIVIIFFLIKEAVKRLISTSIIDIDARTMILIASIGLFANLISVFLIKKHSRDNINLRSAYLHLLADALSSIAVITGGIIIYFSDIQWVDPAITILICLYILKEGFLVIKKAISILMHFTPENIDIESVKVLMEKIPAITNIHHVHVWQLNEKDIFFECHADLHKDMKISETKHIIDSMNKLLMDKMNINHATIQLELDTCVNKDIIYNKGCKPDDAHHNHH